MLLRTELFHLTRQYRKAKRKFDLAVMQVVDPCKGMYVDTAIETF